MSITELEIRQSTLDRIYYLLQTSYQNINQKQWLDLAKAFIELNKTDLQYVDKVEALLLDAYTFNTDNIEDPKDLKALVSRTQLLFGKTLSIPKVSINHMGTIISAGNDKDYIRINKNYMGMVKATTPDINVKIEFETSLFDKIPESPTNSNSVERILQILTMGEATHGATAWVRARTISVDALSNQVDGKSEWSEKLYFWVEPIVYAGFIESIQELSGNPTGIPAGGQFIRLGINHQNNRWFSKQDRDVDGIDKAAIDIIGGNSLNGDYPRMQPQDTYVAKFFNSKDMPHGHMKRVLIKNDGSERDWDCTKPYNDPVNGLDDRSVWEYQAMVKIPEHYVIDGHILINLKSNGATHRYYLKLCAMDKFVFNPYVELSKLPGFFNYDLSTIQFQGRGNFDSGVIISKYQYDFYVGAFGALVGKQSRTIGSFIAGGNNKFDSYMGATSESATMQDTTMAISKFHKDYNKGVKSDFLPINYYEYRALVLLYSIERGYVGGHAKDPIQGWFVTNYSSGEAYYRRTKEYLEQRSIIPTAFLKNHTGHIMANNNDNKTRTWRGIQDFASVWIAMAGAGYDGTSGYLKTSKSRNFNDYMLNTSIPYNYEPLHIRNYDGGNLYSNPMGGRITTYIRILYPGELLFWGGTHTGASETNFACSRADFNGSGGNVGAICFAPQLLNMTSPYSQYRAASLWEHSTSITYSTYRNSSKGFKENPFN